MQGAFVLFTLQGVQQTALFPSRMQAVAFAKGICALLTLNQLPGVNLGVGGETYIFDFAEPFKGWQPQCLGA